MPAVNNLVGNFTDAIIKPAAGILFAAGFFMFVWGLIEFLHSINEGKESNEGKQHMLWGIIGMLIMVSVVGILSLLSDTFNLGYDPKNGTYAPNNAQLQNNLQNVGVGNLFIGH